MKIKNSLLIIIILFFLYGCSSFKKEFYRTGSHNEVIKNAILDFSNTPKLYRKNTAFSVSVKYVQEEVIVIRVGIRYLKMLLTDKDKVGSISKLPSRFIEKDGRLFYWEDDNYPLSQEALDLYQKFGLLQDDENGEIIFPDHTTDEVLKAAHYYFCKNDFSKYRKVITNIGLGYYDPPKLNCKR